MALAHTAPDLLSQGSPCPAGCLDTVLGTEPKPGQLDELEHIPWEAPDTAAVAGLELTLRLVVFQSGDAILMMLLQIQCHFGLAPIDVVAVALDISWPQPLLLLTSFLLPFASLSSALALLSFGKGLNKLLLPSVSHLLPHVATLVHKFEVFCYLVPFLAVF